MTSSSSDMGRQVHDRLLAEGGFCWDHRSDGRETITVHMNKGRVMSAELRALLKRHGAELKAYVFERNDQRRRLDAEVEARWAVMCGRAAPGGVGSSATATPPRRTRGGAHGCDCNGASGSGYARNGRWAPAVDPGACVGVEGSGAGISGGDGGFRAKIAPSAQREEGEGAA